MYWWESKSSENCWVEIRSAPGTGQYLACPLADRNGQPNARYDLVGAVKPGDNILHWHAREHRFVGQSRVLSNPYETTHDRFVDLEGFTPLRHVIDRAHIIANADSLYDLRDYLTLKHGSPLFLPFQYTQDRSDLRFISNYFAKMPLAMRKILLGNIGQATQPVGATASRSGFLQPFKPKADSDYTSNIAGGPKTHSKPHEVLVNACAQWLENRGITPLYNNAIDLGCTEPMVIFEAKAIGSRWEPSIREALGQLYEYRYFKIADPDCDLIFLADSPVPKQWVKYLEGDRGVGVVWQDEHGAFTESALARRMLRK